MGDAARQINVNDTFGPCRNVARGGLAGGGLCSAGFEREQIGQREAKSSNGANGQETTTA